MVKLSELGMDDKLLIEGKYGDSIMSKSEVLEDLGYIKEQGKKIYTTYEYKANINAKWVLHGAIEDEYQNMYEDWDDQAIRAIGKEDVEQFQQILDRILDRTNRISYGISDMVEIDM